MEKKMLKMIGAGLAVLVILAAALVLQNRNTGRPETGVRVFVDKEPTDIAELAVTNGTGSYRVWYDEAEDGYVFADIPVNLVDVDGFFADNCDVYWVHPEENILEGLAVIMKGLKQTGKKVIINGGDTFLDAWCEQKGTWDEVITGINQESVFSAILWDEGAFGTSEEEDREYFMSYVDRYGSQGAEIYLLEYTTDGELIETIDSFCRERNYFYYVSDSVELDG